MATATLAITEDAEDTEEMNASVSSVSSVVERFFGVSHD